MFLTGNWIWDTSRVSFIKKSDKETYMKPGSFRPITVSSYIGKGLERIIERRLRKFCDTFNVLDEEQEGFRPERSTNRYLYKLISSLHEAKQKRLNAILLCIDLEKAFDSVWIPALIVKLNRIGIEGPVLDLINNFLVCRKVSLIVNN